MKYMKKAWRVSLSIDVRITMIRYVVYLLQSFKMFHGRMNNPVHNYILVKYHASLKSDA
jgi:hypothetical protein